MTNLRKFMGMGDVRNAIRRRGKQIAAELKDVEIWMSAEFKSYAEKLADFMLRKRKLYALNILHDENPSAPVAYTDGKKIVLNTGNPLAKHPKLLEGRFEVNLGILFHEVAHKLFLDFDVNNKGISALEKGTLFGTFDVPAGSDLEDNLKELEQAMKDGYAESLTGVYAQVLNIINDGHDEAAIKKCFPGFVKKCIDAAGNAQVALSTSLSANIAKGAAPIALYYNLMLQYAKFGFYNIGEESQETEAYMQLLSRMEPVIDDALAEDDYLARWTYINTLVLMLWPTIKEMIENQPQSSSSGSPSQGTGSGSGSGSNSGSGNAPLSNEKLKELLQKAAEAAQKNNSVAPAPTGSGKAVSVTAVAKGAGGASPNSDQALQAIKDQLGQEKAAAEVQGEIDKAQLEAIRNTNKPLVHKRVPVHTERHHAADKEKYDEFYNEVEPYVRNLISGVLALLREYNEEALIRHKRFGPIIEATEAYRPDGTFFAKKKMPEDRPNMAMCILLDESGSMGGSKINTAKKAMIMLERFAAGIGVPLMVAGHYASGGVFLNIYTDFVSAKPEQDRYALASITSHGCNRDGLPLRLCAEMLAKRPEEIRMMVVISDGAPNHDNYKGEAAQEDIRKTVAEFRRQGLIIYGAAIDEDREAIQKLYGSGFLNITDLKSLPKTLVRLMRQNIV